MRLILTLFATALVLFSCSKKQRIITDFDAEIDVLNSQGESERTFDVGDEMVFQYTMRNTSKEQIEFYSNNCPRLYFKVHDSQGDLVQNAYLDSVSCQENIFVRSLCQNEEIVFKLNWINQFNTTSLPLGEYTFTLKDEISGYGETKLINLGLNFKVE